MKSATEPYPIQGDEIEIKKCPCCGSHAMYTGFISHDTGFNGSVFCSNAECNLQTGQHPYFEAIEKWNARVKFSEAE